MKFKFSYQRVLDHKAALTEAAMREYAEAKNAVEMCRQDLRNLYRQITESRERAFKLTRSGGECSVELRQIDEFILGQLRLIEVKRAKMRELMQVEEEKNLVLVERNQEKRIFEKLKEKRLKQFKIESRKHEAKIINDIVTMRFLLRKDI